MLLIAVNTEEAVMVDASENEIALRERADALNDIVEMYDACPYKTHQMLQTIDERLEAAGVKTRAGNARGAPNEWFFYVVKETTL